MSSETVAAQQFAPHKVTDVEEYGSGNVNDTFLVTVDTAQKGQFILQRINTHVFSQPQLIMLNMRTFTEHVHRRLQREPESSRRRWETPRIVPTRDGEDLFVDSSGSFWRALTFVSCSRCYETVQSIDHARESGYALGRFHSLICDLDARRLHDTLPGFHITPDYLQHYDQVLAESPPATSPDVAYGLGFVEERRAFASVLEDAKDHGYLQLRPIHGDPKVNNIMIDEQTDQAVSIVDLDTVKPGLIHYDVGDCLRSCCNPLGEETDRLEDVRFETDLCRAILQGYLSEARSFLAETDYAYLYDSMRLIAFELGLRFFTDHLEGNVYFKVRHPRHNLDRALVQFKLAESIESQQERILDIIEEFRLDHQQT